MDKPKIFAKISPTDPALVAVVPQQPEAAKAKAEEKIAEAKSPEEKAEAKKELAKAEDEVVQAKVAEAEAEKVAATPAKQPAEAAGDEDQVQLVAPLQKLAKE